MMGSKQRYFTPLLNVSLQELVPHDHFYQHLERTLDLSFVRELVHETCAGGGRPSIDTVVFFKLQLIRPQIRERREHCCYRSPSTSMFRFPFPIAIIAPNALACRSSPTTPGEMSTSVQQAKNSTILRPLPLSALPATEQEPGTAITVHAKPNVPPASKGAVSAAMWMRRCWIGCELITRRKPTRKPGASGHESGTFICRRQTVAWHTALSLTRTVAREL